MNYITVLRRHFLIDLRYVITSNLALIWHFNSVLWWLMISGGIGPSNMNMKNLLGPLMNVYNLVKNNLIRLLVYFYLPAGGIYGMLLVIR